MILGMPQAHSKNTDTEPSRCVADSDNQGPYWSRSSPVVAARRGALHIPAKLVANIRKDKADGKTWAEMLKRNKVSSDTLSTVLYRPYVQLIDSIRSKDGRKCRFTDRQRAGMIKRRLAGESLDEIAAKYGTTKGYVCTLTMNHLRKQEGANV